MIECRSYDREVMGSAIKWLLLGWVTADR